MHFIKFILLLASLCLFTNLSAENFDSLSEEQIIKTCSIIAELEQNLYDSEILLNSSNANDAQITLSAISNQPEPEQININDVIDLRPGSTVFEIIEGVAYFNIILEESLDLQNWSPYGTTISLQLDDEPLTSEAKYYRFRMSD
jgi:hypothetical protein